MVQIFLTFLKLGLTSFGGPVAHLGFFHNEFVVQKKWVNEKDYADLVALCQFLPGPASSQVGMAIGYYRGGTFGAVLAWLGFTIPSAILLVMFALTVDSLTGSFGTGWLHGLKIAAAAVVALAIWEMAKKFSAGILKFAITVTAAIVSLFISGVSVQLSLIVFGAVVGILFFRSAHAAQPKSVNPNSQSKMSVIFVTLYLLFLILLPLIAAQVDSVPIHLANIFYRVGALVFGGGHVVLPLLQTSVVDAGFVSKDVFIAGYGAAQAVPGPLFSLSAYLGFEIDHWRGAVVSLVMIFLPSFFLILGIIPHWEKIRSLTRMRSALIGVNAAVVGLLIAAFYNPIWSTAIFDLKDTLLFVGAFLLLALKKTPSYLVVIMLAGIAHFL